MTSMFQRDFDAEIAAEARAAAAPAAETFTLDELTAAVEAARAQGHAEGHAEGLAQAGVSLEARRGQALDALVPKLDQMLADRLAHRAALEQQMVDFAISVCEKIFPEFIALRSARGAANEVRKVLAIALHSPRLRLRLSPVTRDILGPELEALARDRLEPHQIDIATDASLAPGNAHVSWDDGFAEFSYSDVCDAILEALHAAAKAEATAPKPGASALVETFSSNKVP